MPLRVFLVITAAAVLFDLGGVHRHHNADSFLPVHVSTIRWTPFYWEQDRFGMLTALVARPVANPAANMLVQCGLTAWAGYAAAYFGARWLGGAATAPAVAAIALTAVTLTGTMWAQWVYFSTFTVFAVSTACGLAAFVVLAEGRPRWRWPIALGLLAVGAWVNVGLGLFLGPVGVLVALAQRRGWRAAAEAGLAAGYAVAAGLLLKNLYGTGLSASPEGPGVWVRNLRYACEVFWIEVNPQWWLAALAGFLVLAIVNRDRIALRTLAAVAAGGTVYGAVLIALFMGQWRYASPAGMLFQVAVVGAAVGPWLARHPGWIRPVETAAGVAFLAAGLAVWGWPSLDRVRADLRTAAGADAVDMRALGVTHVAGNYWRVWPAVFRLRWEAHAAGGPPVWGITLRQSATEDLWRPLPRAGVRVGCFADDKEAPVWRNNLAPLRLAETRGGVELWLPAE